MADKTYELKFGMSDGTTKSVQFTAPQGEKGAKGDKGDTGAKGDKGDRGEPGVYILAEGETIADAPADAEVIIDPNGNADLYVGGVKTVNGVAPDENGNVEINAGGASSWNDLTDKPFYSEMVFAPLMDETAMVATEEMNYQAVLPHSISVSDGEEYTVVYNGTEYNCVCTFFNDEENGMVAYMLGNMMALGGEDTGEPFLVLVFPPEIAAMTGMPGGVVPLDGNTEFTLAILGMVEKVVPIPAEYLPPAVVLYVANKYLYKTADTSNSENLLIASELEALVKSGRTIYLYFEEDGGRTYVTPTQIGIASVGGVITTRSADGGYATFAAPNIREI